MTDKKQSGYQKLKEENQKLKKEIETLKMAIELGQKPMTEAPKNQEENEHPG